MRTYQYSISIDGNVIVNNVKTSTAALVSNVHNFGYIVNSTNPIVTITIVIPRQNTTLPNPTSNLLFSLLQVFEYTSVYDPIADCCVDKCPPNSGIVVKSQDTPVACVSCGSKVGLVYNSITGFCQCQTGFYSLAEATSIGNDANCFPCYAKFCTTCTK